MPAVSRSCFSQRLHWDSLRILSSQERGRRKPGRSGLSLRSVGTFRPAGSRAALDSIGFLAGEGGCPGRNVWAHEEATFSRRTAADTLEPWACTCGPPSGGTRTVRWCATTPAFSVDNSGLVGRQGGAGLRETAPQGLEDEAPAAATAQPA